MFVLFLFSIKFRSFSFTFRRNFAVCLTRSTLLFIQVRFFFTYSCVPIQLLGVACCWLFGFWVLGFLVLVYTNTKQQTFIRLPRWSSWQFSGALSLQQVHSLLFLFVCLSSFSYLSCTAPTSSRVQPIAAFFVVWSISGWVPRAARHLILQYNKHSFKN